MKRFRLTALKSFLITLLVVLVTCTGNLCLAHLSLMGGAGPQSMAEIEECETAARIQRPAAIRRMIEHRGHQSIQTLVTPTGKILHQQVFSAVPPFTARRLPHALIQRGPPVAARI